MPFAMLEYEEVPQSRALDCGHYGRCLEFVAHIRWTGFSCRRCPLLQETVEDVEERPAAAVIQFK
jgi:hypothetical protein